MAVPREASEVPLESLKGVGAAGAERLHRLGIRTLQDLLFHLPSRYEDRTRVSPMGTLRVGEHAVVEGEVLLTQVQYGRRRMLVSRLADGTGALTLRFFHFNQHQQQALARGVRLRCFGEVRRGAATHEMVHPEFRRVEPGAPVEEHLTPVYPATEGLQQVRLRGLIAQALARLQAGEVRLEEWLAGLAVSDPPLPDLLEALVYLHQPPPDAPLEQLQAGRHPAQRRLAFEELLAHTLSLRRQREQIRAEPAPPLAPSGRLEADFRNRLPFSLTAAQRRVAQEIAADLARPVPMQRLVQGDVGSGKTVVAALAALRAIESGYQAAVMAPTELLAEQHLRNFRQWLEPLGIRVGWLSGRLQGRRRESALEDIATGATPLVVGTHALFQEGVAFHDLGLVVIDEQHRFGVHQRLALREKGLAEGRLPHQLIMTATPIPRTLAMTAYADLDCSVIDELPPGRTAVETVVMPQSRREEIVARLRATCREGRQVYWVCTLIEQSEALQAQAAEETARMLAEALPEVRVGLVHGRLKGEEKERVMGAFKAHELDLLVATTVIEVGVDVPNASLMIIENAERLGLSQLHQLRGRVGRGSARSSCILMYRPPLSEQARARLGVMRVTNDGFEIARKDLELRGPGEVLGTRQTGVVQWRVADLERDQELMPGILALADEVLAQRPGCVEPLIRRWLGEAERYWQV